MMLRIISDAFWPWVFLLWRNACWSPLPPSLIWFLFLFSLCSLYILYINFLPGICFTNIFSYSMYFLLTLWVVSFDVQFLEFSWSPVFPFIFWMSVPLVSSSSNHCQIQCCEPSSLFASKRFIVLGLTFRFLIHFWVNFFIRC